MRSEPPKFGRTCQAHVEETLANAATTLDEAIYRIRYGKRMTKAEREALWRRLAGVVGGCETVRIWLDMGAPK